METKTTGFIPLSPATIQLLRELEIQKQAILRAVIAQAGVTGGAWDIAADGSGLVKIDPSAQRE